MLEHRGDSDARIVVYHRAGRQDRVPYTAERTRHSSTFQLLPLNQSLLTSTHLQMLEEADAAIILGGGKNAYTAGRIATGLGVRLIPVAAAGGAGERLWQELRDPVRQAQLRLPVPDNWNRLTGTEQDVVDALTDELDAFPRVMVVHGRGADRHRLSALLQSMGVRSPVVLRDELGRGDAIPHKFERVARQADAALVLFTPDEEVTVLLDPDGRAVAGQETRVQSRARQNVSLEFGWFWALLGRHRILMVVKDGVELPSDLAGLDHQVYRESPDERRNQIAAFVESVRRR
jgi:predicted nucleotide-binding protein